MAPRADYEVSVATTILLRAVQPWWVAPPGVVEAKEQFGPAVRTDRIERSQEDGFFRCTRHWPGHH